MLDSKLISFIKENNDIIYQNDFFQILKRASLSEFRNNINMIQIINPSLYMEDKVNEYYDQLLSQFDFNTQLFKPYNEILKIFNNGNQQELKKLTGEIYFVNKHIIDELIKFYNDNKNIEFIYNYLFDITNKKISEIVIDRLFKDTFYNMRINIEEMIRYNQLLDDNEKILSNDKIDFYKSILNIDKISCENKISLYQNLKNKNINLMFYEDLRKLKDLSYIKINNSMIKLDEHPDYKNKRLSNKLGIDVYDLKNKNFIMLVRTANNYMDKVTSRVNCYSLISNENTKVYGLKKFIYGYNSFPIDHVIHVFEADAGTKDIKNDPLSSGSIKVNRIMTPEQLIKGNIEHCEINIVNLNSKDCDGMYDMIKPDFLVVFEQISQEAIEESKRLNIPIVIIKQQLLRENCENIPIYKNNLDDYTERDLFFIEEYRRNHR